MQLLDVCAVAATMTRRRLLLSCIRSGLVALDENPKEGMLPRSEAVAIFEDVVRVGDALRDDWPWKDDVDDGQSSLVENQRSVPWTSVGSTLRKELGEELKTYRKKMGRYDSVLYVVTSTSTDCLERSLPLVRSGGEYASSSQTASYVNRVALRCAAYWSIHTSGLEFGHSLSLPVYSLV